MAPKYKRSTPLAQRVYRSSPALVQQKFPSLNLRRRPIKKDQLVGDGSVDLERLMSNNTLTQMAFAVTCERRDDEIIADSDLEEEVEIERPAKRRRVTIAFPERDMRASRRSMATSPTTRNADDHSTTSLVLKKSNCKSDHSNNLAVGEGLQHPKAVRRGWSSRKSAPAMLSRDNTLTQMDFFDDHDTNVLEEIDPKQALSDVLGSTQERCLSRLDMPRDDERAVGRADIQERPHKPSNKPLGRQRLVIPDSMDLDERDSAINHDERDDAHDSIASQRSAAPAVEAFQTPKKARILEVPSSQTPYATPIQLQSVHSQFGPRSSVPTTPTPSRSRKIAQDVARPVSQSRDQVATSPPTFDLKYSHESLPRRDLYSLDDKSRSSPSPKPVVIDSSVPEHVENTTQASTVKSGDPRNETHRKKVALDMNEDPATRLETSPSNSISAPRAALGLTQINNALANTYAALETQTQRSQTTRKRIHDFNLAMQQAGKETITVVEDQCCSTDVRALIGIDTQLELMNDSVNLNSPVSAKIAKGHSNAIEEVGDVEQQGHHDETSRHVPVVDQSMVYIPATTIDLSPPAWKYRSFVSEPEHFSTAEQHPQQLSSVERSEHRIAFSQASTVPCTPTKLQTFSRERFTQTHANHPTIVDLVTSSPDHQDQAMSSSPVLEPEDESQFEMEALPKLAGVPLNLDSEQFAIYDCLPRMTDTTNERPSGISQLLPSSMLNSDIPLPPRWQESVEVEL